MKATPTLLHVIRFLLICLLPLSSLAQTSITDYVLFSGNGTVPGATSGTPASPGYATQLGSSAKINGGIVGATNMSKPKAFLTGDAFKTKIRYVIGKPILPSDPRIGSLVYALCFIAMMWFLAWLLDRKKIYIKV